MATVKMKAKRRFSYAGKVMEAGAQFEAEREHHAHVLEIAGHATRDTEESSQSEKRRYRRRDMRAEH